MSCVFRTRGFHGYSVQFSPYEATRLACACSQHYGLAGRGSLFILDIHRQKQSGMQLFRKLDWQEGLFDCCWSEVSPNIIASSSADGRIQLWDIGMEQQVPVAVFQEHLKEVYSIDWCAVRGNNKLLSGSWDKTIKLWDMNGVQNSSILTYTGHENTIYCVKWSPHIPDTYASTSGDGTIRIWNTNSPHPAQVIPGGGGEILTCDWTKYDQNILASGSTNNQIRIWDIRNTMQSIQILDCHLYAVRRVKCSPHNQSKLVSVSYDLTTRTWDYLKSNHPQETIQHHTEFVVGIDFNLHKASEIADCSWDEQINVYSPVSL
ncbi:peroxisomal targeting signal 2 receptor-like [Dendronephthya gigantea]|uniref:peroxisomal targeting signal 2 receptor-like n=1 Tax=Dendronephthya gigantea TaxID=151771 RepID=UPI00106C0686|nr:peroxisomal targeting signal 2 receptor-like [Dendronephthya gigantea]